MNTAELTDLMIEICEGNPGAATVMGQMRHMMRPTEQLQFFKWLQSEGITGSKLLMELYISSEECKREVGLIMNENAINLFPAFNFEQHTITGKEAKALKKEYGSTVECLENYCIEYVQDGAGVTYFIREFTKEGFVSKRGKIAYE